MAALPLAMESARASSAISESILALHSSQSGSNRSRLIGVPGASDRATASTEVESPPRVTNGMSQAGACASRAVAAMSGISRVSSRMR